MPVFQTTPAAFALSLFVWTSFVAQGDAQAQPDPAQTSPAQTPPATAPPAQAPSATAPAVQSPPAQKPPDPTAAAQTPPAQAPTFQEGEASAKKLQPRSTQGEVQLELTLEQALKIAVDNDLGLEIEAVASEVASYEYAGSWGSFDPRLTANAAISKTEFEANSSLSGASVLKEDTQEGGVGLQFPLETGGEFGANYGRVNKKSNSSFQLDNPSTTDTLALTFKQPLLRGAWQKYATNTQRQTEIVYQRSIESYRQARQQLLLDVDTAYWGLVGTIELLGVAEATIELGRRQLDQNQRRLDAGVGTGVEVLQAETNVAKRVEERLLAYVNVRNAQDKLKATLFPGTDKASWETQIVPTTPLPENTSAVAPAWDVALGVALENRSELRQQRLTIDIGDLQLERTKSERRWGLNLELSSVARGFDGDSYDAFESAASFEYPANRAALTLDVPILNRSAKNAERAAAAQGRSARLLYAQIESQIVAEVRDAVRQILYQSEAVKAAVKSLELAKRQLAAEEARYGEGLSTTFQVLDFQNQLAEALASEKRARSFYAHSLAVLAKAEGILGEKETR